HCRFADLRGSQAVPIGDQDHVCVAIPVAAMLACAVHQPLDLALGEVGSFNCQVYDGWCAFLGPRFHRDKAPILGADWLYNTRFWHSRRRGGWEFIVIDRGGVPGRAGGGGASREGGGGWTPGGRAGNLGGNVHRSRHALNADTIREMHAAFRRGGRKAIEK